MDRRLGRIAGIVALGLVLARLDLRLLLGGPPWPVVLVASAVLGGIVFWLLGQGLSGRPRLVNTLFALGAAILLLRVSVPETLFAGVIPTTETWPPLVNELSEAVRLIRHGVAPIIPTAGVVAVLALIMWSIGGLFAWGSTNGPVAALFIPLLTLYLQLAVSDRHPVGLTWTIVFVIVIGLGVTAMAIERKEAVGRARDPDGRALPGHNPYLALMLAAVIGLGALVLSETASGLVPSQGVLAWRGGGTGYGLSGSGVAFNRLVDLKQRIISRTNQVLFRATLGPDSPPGDRLYWRMETLDEFDGTAWRRSNVNSQSYDPNLGVPATDDLYLGTSHRILHQVQIDNLRDGVLPTAGVPLQVHELSVGSSAIPPSSLLVLEDSALLAPSGLQRGATYQVVASHADIDADLGALATGEDGSLSPLFAAASAAGTFQATPGRPAVETDAPADLSRYAQLPEGFPSALSDIARERTAGATTDFERAWLLQYWFRDSGDFQYSTDVSTGHNSLDLEAWLTDNTSTNHRIGYCEQFAATMAILGRTLGIPSRVVWGFTPGRLEPQAEGPDVVVVRDTNAHAWVEMWMDGFGWVSFDPTPRGAFQPPSPTSLFDPTQFVPAPGDLDTVTAPTVPGSGDLGANPFVDDPPLAGSAEGARWWLLLIPALALALTAVPSVKWLRRRRRMHRLRRGDITAAWEEIVDRLTDLGVAVPAAKTPMELARETDVALLSLAVGYSAAVYGGRAGTGKESDLIEVEGWLHTNYESGRRMRARLSPRSLIGKSDGPLGA
jgi:transglutaminase-like putative cysteine protease